MRRSLALVAVLAAACASGRPYASADALSREIGCDSRVTTTTAAQRRSGISVQECVVEGVPAIVSVFERAGEDELLEAWRRDVSVTTVHLVVGDHFVVQTKSAKLAQQIAEAVGGKVEES